MPRRNDCQLCGPDFPKYFLLRPPLLPSGPFRGMMKVSYHNAKGW